MGLLALGPGDALSLGREVELERLAREGSIDGWHEGLRLKVAGGKGWVRIPERHQSRRPFRYTGSGIWYPPDSPLVEGAPGVTCLS